MGKQIKITLVKSIIGRLPKHKATLQALGIRKINQTVVHQDTAAMRGMINQVSYLLKVEESVNEA